MAREKLTLKLGEMRAEYAGNKKSLGLANLIEINLEENSNIYVETVYKDENGNDIEEKVVIYKEEGEKDYTKVKSDQYVFKVDEKWHIEYIGGKFGNEINPKEDLEKDKDYEGKEDDRELGEDGIILDGEIKWDTNADKIFLDVVPAGWTGIYTQADLLNMRNNLNGKYILMNDIAFIGTWEPIGNETEEFKGYFNGNGYTITNLKVSGTSGYLGMFGRTAGGTGITNINLKNYTVTGSGEYIGSLVRI